jgi:uncharacterized protein YdhG (YjbR/CyaY superfamily)
MATADVDAYLAALDEPKRGTLEALRRAILDVVPEAEQSITYGTPTFKVRGKAVAGFAAFKQHLSYLPHSSNVLPELGEQLSGYATSKGALRFAVDTPLPAELVEQLIETRLAEIRARF